MRKLLAIVIMAASAYYLTLFGPWYLVALSGFIGGLIIRSQWQGFFIALLTGFALWFVQIQFMQEATTADLPDRMARLIGLPSGLILALVSALIGGLVMGFAAGAGAVLTQKGKRKRRRY